LTSALAGAVQSVARIQPPALIIQVWSAMTFALIASAELTKTAVTEKTARALLTNVFSDNTDARQNVETLILIAVVLSPRSLLLFAKTSAAITANAPVADAMKTK
jgi:hypothetical protein